MFIEYSKFLFNIFQLVEILSTQIRCKFFEGYLTFKVTLDIRDLCAEKNDSGK